MRESGITRVERLQENEMNHTEAVEQMATERYLLDELAPDARDAFEEHVFDCPDCALDLRAGAVFVHEAKAQLPSMLSRPAESARVTPAGVVPGKERSSFWASLWRPAFAAPAFATLLIVLVYQNAITFPALRGAAGQPHIVPVAPVHGATRGGSHISITANRASGVALPIDLPAQPGMAPAASYSLDLRDPKGKAAWSGSIAAAATAPDGDQPVSVVIPGTMLQNGTYALTVTSVTAQGQRTPIGQYIFDIVVTN
jgi:Putative zinc-finger